MKIRREIEKQVQGEEMLPKFSKNQRETFPLLARDDRPLNHQLVSRLWRFGDEKWSESRWHLQISKKDWIRHSLNGWIVVFVPWTRDNDLLANNKCWLVFSYFDLLQCKYLQSTYQEFLIRFFSRHTLRVHIDLIPVCELYFLVLERQQRFIPRAQNRERPASGS